MRKVLILLWLGATAGSFFLDAPVSRWLYDHSFHLTSAGIMRNTPWALAFKYLGDYRAVVVLSVLLVVLAKLHWRKAAVLLMCGAASIVGSPLKFMVGRGRPLTQERLLASAYDFVPFSNRDGGMGFPSGHALLAFATAVCIARYYPKWAGLAYTLAALVAVERVLELSHHLSDIIASCGLALLMTHWLVGRLENRIMAGQVPALEEEEIAA